MQTRYPPLRRLAALDEWLFLTINQAHQHLRLRETARFLSWTGDGYLYVLMAVAFPYYFSDRGEMLLLAGLIGFAFELPVYELSKRYFRRPRPFHVLADMTPLLHPRDEFSCPSGHTTAAFMVAGLTSALFPAVAPLAFAWATLIGLARVMLKLHYVSDVLAGMILGSGIAMLSLWLAEIVVFAV